MKAITDSRIEAEFPVFRPLKVDDNDLIRNLIPHFKPSAIFNLTCLITWHELPCEISFLHNNIVLKTQDVLSNATFFTLLGEHNLIAALNCIFAYQAAHKLETVVHLIPEDMLLLEPKIQKDFLVKEERDYFNYVYLLDRFRKLAGGKMQSQRREIKHLLAERPDLSIEIAKFDPAIHEKVIFDLFKAWELAKNKSALEDKKEWAAIKSFTKLTGDFPFYIAILKDKKELLGFLIVELLHQAYIIGHFMKILPGCLGGEDAMFHQVAEEFFPKGYRYFNTEEDLGIENLRKHKLGLHPEFLIKYYSISPK